MTVFDPGEFGGVDVGGTAPVTFKHGSGPVDPAIVISWDFDNDGDFSEPVEDVTKYVISIETATGRDFPSQLTGKATPGRLRMTLDNRDGRFSFFNQSSPLNAAPFSLRTGRKIRVRTSESAPTDPTLLIRDRFNRPNGTLATTETGQTWSFGVGGVGSAVYKIEDQRAVAVDNGNNIRTAFVNTGSNDHYVQATMEQWSPVGLNHVGLIARRIDNNNYVYARVTSGAVRLGHVVLGIATDLATYLVNPWQGVTIGLKNGPSTAIALYVNGAEVKTSTTSLAADNEAGLEYRWDNSLSIVEPPIFDNFHVFSGLVTETEGVLWTGDVSDVKPNVSQGQAQTVEVTAEGFLARAALPDVVSPRAYGGARTGVLVGDALSKAGLLLPPATIQEGLTTTGPVAIDDGNALEMARKFEETEVGFLRETNEGPIAFDSRNARAGAVSVAVFSDSPGAQFGYAEIEPYDQRREIVNRVTAGVAPEAPSGITTTVDSASTASGVSNNVTVDIPALSAGDVCIVFIASTVGTATVNWLNPIWWQNHRDQLRGDLRTRVYSHFTGVAEAATTVTFYTDSGASGGAWIAHIYKISGWYKATQGLAISEFVNGANPPPFDHGFGRTPTLFIALNGALTSVNGGGFVESDQLQYPEGYLLRQASSFTNGSVNGFDVGIATADRIAVAESDDPTTFNVYQGFVINESAVFAVRGFNGPHVVLPTLKNPSQFEASPGRFVTIDDTASQDEQRAIRSHNLPSNLLANEADAEAYGDTIIATYSDDRPIVSISFRANKTAAYRAQAIRRRVGHKIHLTANNPGPLGSALGIEGDFFIENISHSFTGKRKVWDTTWELSPA